MASFVTGDTHFGHTKSLTFLGPDGSRIRPFESLDEMHQAIIDNWNKVVHPKDTVYHMGDVAIARSGLKILDQLNGRKILIRGNHDIFKLRDYTQYFADIRGCHFKDNLIFCHIPVHRDSFEGRYKGCVHGHLHIHHVMHEGKPDPLYFNTCVEVNNFTPVSIDTVKQYFTN